MSELPVYSFFPWLRQGLGNQITDDDTAGRLKLRSEIAVALELTGTGGPAGVLTQPISRTVPLAGPGDIVGIDSRMIVRTEPRNWITQFEPNYIPCIEFYEEDFPWRYTPAKADIATHRLRPWIALIVLEEAEFQNGESREGLNPGDRPLPYIIVDNPAFFPPADQLWAWAHVHVNRGMIDEGMRTPAGVADPRKPAMQWLEQTLDENADLAYSRIVCPRKLKENTPYHAFLVPVFETGRLTGLGLDPAKAPEAMQSAWGAYNVGQKEDANKYPYYYRWYFHTGTVGDFEYLVRLLKPRTVDKRVGTRDMDVQDPDANLPGITDPKLAGVLKLGGALKVPRKALSASDWDFLQTYENWATPYPRPFQEKLAALINLADDYKVKPAISNANHLPAIVDDDDPLLTPPLYGQWHAMQQRLLQERDGRAVPNKTNWLHQLNLDPRHRVTAGFGTRVVQEKQEDLMDAAWRQVGAVLEAQRRIRNGQLIKQVSWIWHARHIEPLLITNPERAFIISAPLHSKVLAGEFTAAHTVRQSALPAAAMSAQMRRMLRPRARLAAKLRLPESGKPQRLLRRLNSKEISAALPRPLPAMLVSPGDVAAKLRPPIPGFLMNWLRKARALPWLVLLVLLVAALLIWLWLPSGSTFAVAIGIVASVLVAFLRRWSVDLIKADTLDDEIATPDDVDDMPKIPGFAVAPAGQEPIPAAGEADSPEGTRFKDGLRGLRRLIGGSKAAAAEAAKKGPMGNPLPDFNNLAKTVVAAINPDETVPLRTLAGIRLPDRLAPLVTEKFREPFAYPQFDMPMYKPLADISSELFLPNLNLIEQNSITLLETNQTFIEAYMVGLNHEIARELLWREYPTDQRGSYFRQFWDVSAFLDPQAKADLEAQKEKLRDISMLHRWSRSSVLKDHDNRQRGDSAQEELVLTIRGELLKKYPNAVIYAHKAVWQLKKDGSAIDPMLVRLLVPLTETDEDNPPRSKVRTPLYGAKVEPDIFFFGFDLTDEEVKGGTGENPGDGPGWFFVIKERPGEPRFGFDIGKADPNKIHVWNDLGWDNVQPDAAGSYVVIDNAMNAFEVKAPTSEEDKKLKSVQHKDDVAIKWNKDMNAADVAYVMYQAPVLVAIHGAEMLKPED